MYATEFIVEFLYFVVLFIFFEFNFLGAVWSDETYTAEVISPPYNLAWYSCVASAKTRHFSRHLYNQHLSGKYWFTTQRVHNTSKSIIIFPVWQKLRVAIWSGNLLWIWNLSLDLCRIWRTEAPFVIISYSCTFMVCETVRACYLRWETLLGY